jgi:hypothetical protein
MFVYGFGTSAVAENFATSGTANTPIESVRINPGTGRAVSLQSILAGGKGAALTSLSGISYRIRKWTTTAAAGGTSLAQAPRDLGAQAAKFTTGGASAGVTGGPTYLGGFTTGGAGPGGWTAPNADSMPVLESAATQSFGIWVQSGTISMNYEITNVECVE